MEKKVLMAGFLAALFLIIAGIFAGVTHAQTLTGEAKKIYVDVYVVDEKGNPVPNATVQVLTNMSAVVSSQTTNSEGEAIIILTTNLTNGAIKVFADNYGAKTIDNVNLSYNATSPVYASYLVTLGGNGYVDKARNIYEEHKTAVIAGGAVIFFVIILIAIGTKNKGSRKRW